jgi:hypothetical protein
LPETPTVDQDSFERSVGSTRRPVVSDGRHPKPMGPPFLNEPPQDYPSHLGPVPRAPEWEQVVPGPTPWSPLAPPPHVADWGQAVTGIECRRTEDGGHINCITPGGLAGPRRPHIGSDQQRLGRTIPRDHRGTDQAVAQIGRCGHLAGCETEPML